MPLALLNTPSQINLDAADGCDGQRGFQTSRLHCRLVPGLRPDRPDCVRTVQTEAVQTVQTVQTASWAAAASRPSRPSRPPRGDSPPNI